MEASGQNANVDAKDLGLFCHPCGSEGTREAPHGYCKNCSEYLCEACYKIHTKPTPCKHHVLLEVANMPQLPLSFSKGTIPVVKCTKICSNHADKVVEIYCATHGTAVCGLCAFHSHMSCNVEDIMYKAINYTSSPEYTGLKDTIAQIESDVESCLIDAGINLKDNKKCIGEVIDEVRKYRAEINTRLKKKEEQLLVQVTKVEREDGDKLKTVQADCQIVKSDITQLKLTLTKQENNHGNLFVTAKQTIPQVQGFKERLVKCKIRNKASDYSFIPHQDIETLLNSLCPLGELFKPDKISKLPDINVKSSEDKKDCRITGATLLSPNRLLVVDVNNDSVKNIDIVNNTVISSIKLHSWPLDITSLPQQQAAITLPAKHQIQVLSTTGELSLLRSISVKGDCCGIGSTEDKLIASYTKPIKVEVMDHHGAVLRTIASNARGQPLFMRPYKIAVTSEGNNETMIYVSDGNSNSVTKLNLQGQVILLYRGEILSSLRGLSVTQNGQMLISNGNNIQKVSLDGKKTGILLDKSCGITNPWSVCYCPVESKVYISCYCLGADPAIKNTIKVFSVLSS